VPHWPLSAPCSWCCSWPPAAPAARQPAQPDEPPPLRVGVVPNVAPEQQRARYAPLADQLEDRLGRDVELVVASNYAGVVTALAAGRLDVAYLGGLTYVQAERQVPLTPLVTEVDQETRSPQYLSAVVVRRDAPHRSAADLVRGRASFAFGDPASTSGSLYPRLAQQVEQRRVQGYPWVGRTALGGDTLDDVRQAFLDIDDPALLDLLRAERYVPVQPADYDEVRRSAARLGLLR
jgi:phosphate/phosphite/phosphonate ABC transporter binding protein